VPLKRRAAPRAEIMGWDGSAWQKLPVESATYPNLRVRLFHGGTGTNVFGAGGDARSNTNNPFLTESWLMGFNGSSWDRWRNNIPYTLLPSATRTASGYSADQVNYNARGVILWLYISAVSGTFATGEGLRIRILGKDITSGRYGALTDWIGPYTIVTFRTLACYPGARNVQGVLDGANDLPLPRIWRVQYDITGTNPSFTFSVGASYIV